MIQHILNLYIFSFNSPAPHAAASPAEQAAGDVAILDDPYVTEARGPLHQAAIQTAQQPSRPAQHPR